VASYYYFGSSLPLLRPEGPLPCTSAAFLARAEEQLNRRDYSQLEAALSGDGSTHPFFSQWMTFNASLQAELAAQRSRRLGWGEQGISLDRDLSLSEAVSSIVAGDDPLQAELALLRLQWRWIDEMVGFSVFNLEAMLGYLLKLQLLERRGLFDQSEGNVEFERLFNDLQRDIAKR
jgi:hypothetical protein